jgi:DNA-directed RNA polymerase specialized sigma24 family protein
MDQPSNDLTQLLKDWCAGDERALEKLAVVVESELRRLARVHLSKGSSHTLQPTALMNEVYLRLMAWNTDWQNRTHFFAVASKIMRQVLVNQAIARSRQKRGGNAVLVSLTGADNVPEQNAELRFFGGLTAEETAEVLGISLRTVHREWDMARTWLFRELRGTAGRAFGSN